MNLIPEVVVDSSVLIAILEKEVDAAQYAFLLQNCGGIRVSSVTVFETSIVLLRKRGAESTLILHEFLVHLKARTISFSLRHALIARDIYAEFGKGIHSKARLNLGDCASYATARILGAPLLYKGDDFTHTPIGRDWLGLVQGQ